LFLTLIQHLSQHSKQLSTDHTPVQQCCLPHRDTPFNQIIIIGSFRVKSTRAQNPTISENYKKITVCAEKYTELEFQISRISDGYILRKKLFREGGVVAIWRCPKCTCDDSPCLTVNISAIFGQNHFKFGA